MTVDQPETLLALGLMSGTSADGVDAALVRTDGDTKYEFVDAITLAYDASLQGRLIEAAEHDIPLDQLLDLEQELTQWHVRACQQLLRKGGTPATSVQIIGFHGHTIRHDRRRRCTWQLGNASLLAAELHCDVVSDFRRRDIAQGGNGAPLVPLFHRCMFRDSLKLPTLVLNLGGVANITYLDPDGPLLASDTGPGCGLLDALARRELGQACDRDGKLASGGRVHRAIVDAAMQQAFFTLDIPKSADRFEFRDIDLRNLSAADQAATLCALTVAGVKSVVDQLPRRPAATWVTGGGVRHPTLMSMLRAELGNVNPIEVAGFRSDSLEAECFAWLAVRRLRRLPTSLPETTGCDRPTCGGSISLGRD